MISSSLAAGLFVWSTPPLDVPSPADASRTVVDHHGQLLRAYTTAVGRWRLPATIDDVDPTYLKLLLAFEDRRFWSHPGVDIRAVLRAGLQSVQHGRIVSGASTLTMQVARLIAAEHPRSLSGKATQMARALHLERHLTKREILTLYLRLAPFGGNIEGVRAAALAYFGREPKRLSLAEAALLVALPQSPERRRPDHDPRAAEAARNHVLDVAVARGIATAAEAAGAKRQPVPRARKPFPILAPHLADALVRDTGEDGAIGGGVIRTHLDRDTQSALETLAAQAARRHGDKISVAILAARYKTGAIVAHVGSAGYLNDGRLGAIDMTRAQRSPGSTLKPLVYGLGFDDGLIHPQTLIDDVPTRFGAYRPRNFSGDYQGTVTISEALAASLNVPAVKVLDRLGPGRLIGRLKSTGVGHTLPAEARANLSVALGGLGMSLTDLVELYAMVARGGDPVRLTSRPNGESPGPDRTRLLQARSAHWLTRILRNAPPPPNAIGGRIAFKTGTSYGHRDAWAIGYDGKHVVGVWIGRADATAVPGLVGRTAAAPILFDAFRRLKDKTTAFPPAKAGHRLMAGSELPAPLVRFERGRHYSAGKRFLTAPLKIAFPPDRSVLSAYPGAIVILRAEGGRGDVQWLVDGRPIEPETGTEVAKANGETLIFRPEQPGFVRFTVIDEAGDADRTTVRFIAD